MERLRGQIAIVGIGVTQQGRKLGVTGLELRRQALELALADAGVDRSAIDGYIHASTEREDLRYLGLSPHFSWAVQSGGATAPCSFAMAAGAILTGQAEMIACGYGAAPSTPVESGGVGTYGAYGYGYPMRVGMVGAASAHALHARWHMDHYGTTSRHLGAVAVQLRDHASKRPDAVTYGEPITIEQHQASPMIVDPFRLLDCCRDTDGGSCFLLTSAERARSMPGVRPLYLLGMGFGHNIRNWHERDLYRYHDDIAPAAARAFAQAGVGLSDIDTAQFYDPFTISVLMQLEHYGFCKPGQGGPFVEEGGIAVDGVIPVNTGGGQLSGFYAQGFTPIIEAARQLRGEAGATQVSGARLALTSGHGLNGGIQNTWSHGTLILGNEA
ncbi:thiolase family protein [Sphingobium tyrosinilyticum]|uniref:Thiolase family protein n=1 Tax=Sphingobium tyrosinilyticum TaxID=2715436 RepID=A0ABV9F3T0_9SPHN